MSAENNEPSPARQPAPDREAVEELLAQLEREGRWHWPVARLGCVIFVCLFLGMLTICSAPLLGRYGLLIVATAAGMMWLFSRLATSQKQKDLAVKLTQRYDPRVVGPLLTALTWPDMEYQARTIEAALIQMLPRLRASDTHLLDAPQRACLYLALRRRSDDLILAILAALEQIGDEAAIPHVQWLANRWARTPSRQKIHAAARDCLVTLRSRAERTGQGLLRPAGSPDDPAETLLRPAGDASPSDPGRLLRPTEGTRDEE